MGKGKWGVDKGYNGRIISLWAVLGGVRCELRRYMTRLYLLKLATSTRVWMMCMASVLQFRAGCYEFR